MRDLGTPVYPKRFFAAVLKASGAAAHLHVVRHQGQPVAASMTIAHAQPRRGAVGIVAARGADA